MTIPASTVEAIKADLLQKDPPLTRKQIAARHGAKLFRVATIARSMGLYLSGGRSPGSRINAETTALIDKALAAKPRERCAVIAARLRISKGSVHKRAKEIGVKLRRSELVGHVTDKMRRFAELSKTINGSQIAEQENCTRQAVSRTLQRAKQAGLTVVRHNNRPGNKNN